MANYGRGTDARAVCDICGFICGYLELKDYIFDRRPTGLRVCPDCFDVDNPQTWVGSVYKTEPQALYQPRPNDINDLNMTGPFGWNPVTSFRIRPVLGKVEVITA